MDGSCPISCPLLPGHSPSFDTAAGHTGGGVIDAEELERLREELEGMLLAGWEPIV